MRGLKRSKKLACLCVVHLLSIFSCPLGLSANVVTLQRRVIEAGKKLQQNAILKGLMICTAEAGF